MPDLPRCVHDVDDFGPPCVRFYPVWCHDPWCWPDLMFCEPPVPPVPWVWCPASTEPKEYVSDFTFFRNICPPSCECSPLHAVCGVVNIWGGEIDRRESCTEASPWTCGSGCEPFSCGDVLCPGKAAVFHPDPTNATAANASEYDWIWQSWTVTEAPLCEESVGTWQPDDEGHPWSSVEITDNRPCLVFGPGRYRAMTDARFGGYDCYYGDGPDDWCEVTVTDWGGWWSNSSDEHTTIRIGRTETLYLWMQPWWLDRGMATLEVSDYAGVVRVNVEGSPVRVMERVRWNPPHCYAPIEDPEVDSAAPIADGLDDMPWPVGFDVTGLQEGQVTFTLRFDPGTGASCDLLTFTADVVCCCDVCEEEENALWLDYTFGIGSCPMHCTPTESDPLEDDCNHRIVLTCGRGGACIYQYFFDESTLVGQCIYDCGVNAFQVKYNPGRCRIVKTRHRTQDQLTPGCDEGTADVYDWQVYVYDACTGTGTGYCREGQVVGWESGGTSSDCEAAWW